MINVDQLELDLFKKKGNAICFFKDKKISLYNITLLVLKNQF